jgi:hypothetical protein
MRSVLVLAAIAACTAWSGSAEAFGKKNRGCCGNGGYVADYCGCSYGGGYGGGYHGGYGCSSVVYAQPVYAGGYGCAGYGHHGHHGHYGHGCSSYYGGGYGGDWGCSCGYGGGWDYGCGGGRGGKRGRKCCR